MLDLIYLILILSITIFVHELGHFIFAKKAKIYVYEFAIGMGPRIFSFKRKNDETIYAIRLIPLGGFVSMAGEQVEEDEKIPKENRLQSKTWFQKFMAVIAGVLFNFIFAIILIFGIALIYGSPNMDPVVKEVVAGYPADQVGITEGDRILKIDNKKINTWDDVILAIQLNEEGKELAFEVKKESGETIKVNIKPKKEEIDGEIHYLIGVNSSLEIERGLIPSIEYTIKKTGSLFKTMFLVIKSLITGDLGLNKVSGPVGIYGIVGEHAEAGFVNVLNLIALLSVNIGFINLLPIPAFDGGRLLFLIIEKIKGKPINPKIENYIHAAGFVFLIGLIILITFNDIMKLFN